MKDEFQIIIPCIAVFLGNIVTKNQHNWKQYLQALILGLLIYIVFSDKSWANEYKPTETVIEKLFTPQEFEQLIKKQDNYRKWAEWHLGEARKEIDKISDISVRNVAQALLSTWCIYQAAGTGPAGAVAVAYATLNEYGIKTFCSWCTLTYDLAYAHYYYSLCEWIDQCIADQKIYPFEIDALDHYIGERNEWNYWYYHNAWD